MKGKCFPLQYIETLKEKVLSNSQNIKNQSLTTEATYTKTTTTHEIASKVCMFYNWPSLKETENVLVDYIS